MTAMARIRRALLLAVMPRDLVALRAIDTLGIPMLEQPVETGRIIGKHLVKFKARELALR